MFLSLCQFPRITLNSPSMAIGDGQVLNVWNRTSIRLVPLTLFLLVLISSTSFPGNGQAVQSLGLQENSLSFTIQPDRSIGVSWNTTSNLASTMAQNASSLFQAGYAIHSSSSFSQQPGAVVQTSTVQYQLPQQLVVQTPLSNVNSISLTSTRNGSTSQASLRIDTSPAVILPADDISLDYYSSLTRVQVNASAQLFFFTSFSATSLWYLTNQTAFQSKWDSTFANTTWTSMIVDKIQNSTRNLVSVTTFYGTMTTDSSSARVSLTLEARPMPPLTDFVAVVEQLLSSMGSSIPMGLDSIIRSALTLTTSGSSSLTYTGSTRTVVSQSTTTYVADLDSQLNRLKDRFFQLLFSTLPAGTPIPPQVLFLNSTSLAISKVSTTSDLDLSSLTSKMTLQGLFLKPPTVGSNTNFTIPGLFQTIGTLPSPRVNLTLTGGSNATHSVRVIVPSSIAAPSSMTTSSATWMNLRDVSALSQVRFSVERLPVSLADLLLSPAAIAVEAVGAVAAAAGVIFFLRRRRAASPLPVPSTEPAPSAP